MLFNKNNLLVAKVASRGNGLKPVLESVFFTKDKTVATDSYKLIEMSVPADLKPECFVANNPKRKPLQGFRPFFLPARAVAGLKLPSKGALDEHNAMAILHRDEMKVEVALGSDEIRSIKPIIGEQFPDYERVFPTGKPLAEVKISAEHLGAVLDIMGKLAVMSEVRIKIYGANRPVVVEAGNDKQKARAMVMPMAS